MYVDTDLILCYNYDKYSDTDDQCEFRKVVFYMKKKLFGNNIKPSCKYCELGTAMGDDKIQCSKFGAVKSYDSCKKFVYSPLKRIPKKEIQLANSDVNNINF